MKIGDRTTETQGNDKCPFCGRPMQWTEGLLAHGSVDHTLGRYSCSKCHAIAPMGESREVKQGRKIAKSLPKNIKARDKRITQYSTAIQIGILRQLQHPNAKTK